MAIKPPIPSETAQECDQDFEAIGLPIKTIKPAPAAPVGGYGPKQEGVPDKKPVKIDNTGVVAIKATLDQAMKSQFSKPIKSNTQLEEGVGITFEVDKSFAEMAYIGVFQVPQHFSSLKILQIDLKKWGSDFFWEVIDDHVEHMVELYKEELKDAVAKTKASLPPSID